jgi:hypothetical protein
LIIAGGWCTPNEQTEREFKQERENQLRTHWYLAVCVDCPQTQPFRNEIQREEWADGHATTGHRIELREVWA